MCFSCEYLSLSSPYWKLTPSSTRLRYRIRQPGRAEAEADDLRSDGSASTDPNVRDAGLIPGTRHAIRSGTTLDSAAVNQDRHPAERDAGDARQTARDTGGRGRGCRHESPEQSNISGQQTSVSSEQEAGQQGPHIYGVSIGCPGNVGGGSAVAAGGRSVQIQQAEAAFKWPGRRCLHKGDKKPACRCVRSSRR